MYVRIDRMSRTGKPSTETYTGVTKDVADFMLSDVKNHAPKRPGYVCMDIVDNGAVVEHYDSRTEWEVQL